MNLVGLAPGQYPEFVGTMNRSSIPWPETNPEQIEREARVVVQAIREKLDED
jgi:hypothetical protein